MLKTLFWELRTRDAGTSLEVQWLRLHSSNMGQVQSLTGKINSHKSHQEEDQKKLIKKEKKDVVYYHCFY